MLKKKKKKKSFPEVHERKDPALFFFFMGLNVIYLQRLRLGNSLP
jgi:hypothetical protein